MDSEFTLLGIARSVACTDGTSPIQPPALQQVYVGGCPLPYERHGYTCTG